MTPHLPDRPAPSALRSGRSLMIAAHRTQRWHLLAATVLLCCHQLGEALVPVIIGAAISRAIAAGGLADLGLWLTVLAVDFAFLSLSYRFGSRLAVFTQERVAHRLRMWVTGRVLAPEGGVHQPPGELVSRATSDAGRVAALAPVVGMTTAALTVLVVSTVLLLRYSVLLGLVIVLGTLLLVTVIGSLAPRFGAVSDAEQQATARAAALVDDYLRGLRSLVGVGAQRTAADHHADAATATLGTGMRAASALGLRTALSVMLTGAYLALIAAVGGVLALHGDLDLGSLIASLGLAQFLIGPLQVLGRALSSVGRARSSAERIRSLLGRPGAVGVAAAPIRIADGDVVFDGVELPGGQRLDLVVEGGRLTGLAVTESTVAERICALLAREHDPAHGELRINGTPIGSAALDDLRALVMVAPHDARLFPGTVADNVAAAPDSRDHGRAVRAAIADEVVRSLPDGPATEIGTDGLRLSGGQRQRIALARALAAGTAILVLQDPTTAVDAATERLIAERLREFRSGRTTIIVTSSPTLLKSCEQVVFVRSDGVGRGHHDELYAESDEYRRLVHR